MKKQLLTGAFLLASLFAVQAQEIYTQDFTNAPEGWTVSAFDGDANNFGLFNTDPELVTLGFTGRVIGSANFTIANQQLTPIDATDNATSSALVTLPAEGSAYLSFRVGSSAVLNDQPDDAAHYSAYVLTDAELEEAGITDAASFAAYLDTKTADATGDIANSSSIVNVDLTDWMGQEVFVLFRHHATNQQYAYLFIDDVIFAEGTAGVNENILANLSVYPNPANDVVNVTVDALVSNVAIVDLNGRTVKSVKFDGVSTASVNVSDLASGVYMMTVSSDKGTTTKKIVKN